MRKLLAVSIAFLAALLLLLVTLPALAQTGNCGGDAHCVADYQFTSDAETWWNDYKGINLDWLSSQSFGMFWWISSANGVIKGSDPAVRVYLTPGWYKINTRLATDGSYRYRVEMNYGSATGNIWAGDIWTVGNSWTDYTADAVYVGQAGSMQFDIINVDPSQTQARVYVDDFQILADTTFTPTPLPTIPVGPGTPTSTPMPATTPSPTAVAATPLPVGTQICQANTPTATPPIVPGPYGVTATPTATVIHWAYYENFDDNLNASYWTMNNTSFQVGHGHNNSAYSLQLPMSNLPSLPAATLASQGIVFTPGGTMPSPVYVQAWAQAQFVPEGVTIYVDVFKRDGGAWSLVESVPVSYQHWYPFQVTVDSSGGTAIAFGAHRSDAVEDPSTPVFLDDVYLYASTTDLPYCDGSIPSSAIDIGSADNNPDTTGGSRYFVIQPADRDCPPDQIIPNNFWGALLSGIIRILDVTFGSWPTHVPGQTAQLFANLIASPIMTFAVLAMLFVDLRIPLACGAVVLGFESVQPLIAIYKFIISLLPW